MHYLYIGIVHVAAPSSFTLIPSFTMSFYIFQTSKYPKIECLNSNSSCSLDRFDVHVLTRDSSTGDVVYLGIMSEECAIGSGI